MTGIEQRLADALAARAGAVDVGSVRPLPPTELVPEPRPSRSRRWLAPAAAAISIALVAAVVTVISRHAPGAGQDPIVSERASFHGQLLGVDALSPTDAWAVGIFMDRSGGRPLTDKPLTMHWDGSKWRRVTTPAGVSGVLLSIAGRSPDDIWAVGTWNHNQRHHNLPLIMHWNGKRWRLAQFAAGSKFGELYSVSALSATDAWAVGSAGNSGALLLHWNGRTWRQLPAPHPVQSQFLESVAAFSVSDAWAVGAENSGEVIMHWNGSRWALARGPASGRAHGDLMNLTTLSASEIWAIGYGSGNNVLRVLHWNGTAWHVQPGLNVLGSEFFYAAAATTPDSLWAVGRSSTAVVIRHWNGTRWSAPVRFTRQLPGILYGIAATSASDVWAIGNHGYGNPTPLVLHWNGTSWSKVLS